MRRFLTNSLIASIIVAFAVSSCIRSEYMFGNDMLDSGTKMESGVDTFYLTKTYQCVADSFPSSSSTSCYIGRWHSDSLGTCTASAVSNYFPMGFKDYTFFGSGAATDSIKLTLFLNNFYGLGDSTISMKVNIYRINGHPFNKDSTYYTNFPIEKYIDPTPLATITTDNYHGDTNIVVKLPKWFADQHFDNRQDTSNIYSRDDKFTNQINGLYFTAEPVNPHDSRIINVNLTASSMRLFYHNNVYPDSLLYQSYYFFNTSMSSFTSNFEIIRNDFTTAKPELGGMDYRTINDTLEPQGRLFISCPQQLFTRIDFDTSILNRLKVKADEAGYKYVVVQGAELRIKLPNTDYKTLDRTIGMLKLYVDIRRLRFLPEYNPFYTQSAEYNTINGTLIRSLGYYTLNITGYVQRLLNNYSQPSHLDLYPVYSTGMSWGDAYIGGSEDEEFKPELIVTYTFIEKKR